MGTTVEKLNKVLETKEAIRTAINNKGGTLNETDAFASYPSAIDSLSGGSDWLKELLDKTKDASYLFRGKFEDANYNWIPTIWLSLTDEILQNALKYNTTSNVTNMNYMFEKNSNITAIPLFDTSNVTDMSYMFNDCSSLRTIPLFDTSNVTNMQNMFSSCSSLTNIPKLNTSKVTRMSQIFYGCSSLTTIPQLNTSSVTNMSYMFSGCSKLTTIPQLDTSKVTIMSSMFSNCSSLITIPQLDTSKVTQMDAIFQNCSNLTTIPQLNTSSATIIYQMFQNCPKLRTIDITHMNSTDTYATNCFAYNCHSLTKFIIRNMNTIPALNENAFDGCYHFTGTVNATYNPDRLKDGRIYVPDDKVEELKKTINWSKYDDIIVPLSTLVE